MTMCHFFSFTVVHLPTFITTVDVHVQQGINTTVNSTGKFSPASATSRSATLFCAKSTQAQNCCSTTKTIYR